MKNLQKKISEFLPASSTKKSVQNFFCFTGKICLFEISLYIQKTGFFSVFADGRIKPRSHLKPTFLCFYGEKDKFSFIVYYQPNTGKNFIVE
jgi:hypothetical protein